MLLPLQAGAAGMPTLDVIEVKAGAQDLIGVADAASVGTVTAKQLENRPLLRPAEVLETVPGLIVTQHAGDGKANQYFLRGFNLDHGTDFSVAIDGMPINLPTHAHGHGYLDLNFLIPELVERIQYKKGPYAAEDGDFSSAGSARIDYRRALPEDYVSIGLGSNGYRRLLTAADKETAGGGRWLGAVEVFHNDGPWEVPEHYKRLNGVLRYSEGTRNNGHSVAFMAYDGDWTSTDQLARRAVDQGLVNRYGSLDPTAGGNTRRLSLSGQWARQDGAVQTRANAYLVDYRLNLFSNFTYAMDDPVNGDQFEQADRRRYGGFGWSRSQPVQWLGKEGDFTWGVQGRQDDIDNVGLYRTAARQRLSTVRSDSVNQGSLGLYGQWGAQWTDWLRSVAGLRHDRYRFKVDSSLAANSGKENDGITSPKLSLIFGPFANQEFYYNWGQGFHSNDARGTTIRVDPSNPGDPMSRVPALVKSRGQEMGWRSAPAPGWNTSVALWRLDLDSELLFVGDAGTTEAGRPSHRQGVEWSNYWTPRDWLTLDADIALSKARFRDDSSVGNHVPGAVERTASVGVAVHDLGPWRGGLRLRYLGPRALIENNSVRSGSSVMVNLNVGYKLAAKSQLTLEVLNLFNRKASDIDYYYESRLRGEAAAKTWDVHSHPAEPRIWRLTYTQGF
ncbi:outer membrane receptor protein involved in Fe transport [Azospira oryzae]|uniref:Outer membrane receptor protein involved in Fe transport n=2 Tax=Azospira oryzae TaxID=146939 RepID=A0ABY0ILU4_9RHOO|nr:outer membrane receptor protein involved in Fe transport [Azospira oryzae]